MLVDVFLTAVSWYKAKIKPLIQLRNRKNLTFPIYTSDYYRHTQSLGAIMTSKSNQKHRIINIPAIVAMFWTAKRRDKPAFIYLFIFSFINPLKCFKNEKSQHAKERDVTLIWKPHSRPSISLLNRKPFSSSWYNVLISPAVPTGRKTCSQFQKGCHP